MTDPESVAQLIAQVREIHVAEAIQNYIVSIIRRTRSSEEIDLGASPRATLALYRTAQAWAAMPMKLRDARSREIPRALRAHPPDHDQPADASAWAHAGRRAGRCGRECVRARRTVLTESLAGRILNRIASLRLKTEARGLP